MKHEIRQGVVWVGALMLATTAALAVVGNTKGRPVRARSAVTDPAAREVVETVDRLVQDRFRRPLDERFGISRIALPEDRRMIHSRSNVPGDLSLLEKAEAQQRAYRVFYLTTRPLSDDGLKAKAFPHSDGLTLVSQGDCAARQPLPAAAVMTELNPLQRFLKEGRSVEAGALNWRIHGRTVLAEKSCVSCHTAAKEGEVLGAVIYAVEGS
jgi:hypothetical protein